MSGRQFRAGGQSGSAGRHLLALLALVLVCYAGVKAFYGHLDSALDGSPDAARQRPSEQAAERQQASADSSHIDKEAITRRNLFLPPSRQQSGPVPDDVSARLAGEPDLLLVGTVVDSAGANRAVILDVEEKKQLMLREGDMINGASIRRIDPGKVVISRQGRNELLDIAEALKIRAAIGGAASPGPATALGTIPALPADSSPADTGQSENEALRVDLGRLQGAAQRVIVKGRVSKDI